MSAQHKMMKQPVREAVSSTKKSTVRNGALGVASKSRVQAALSRAVLPSVKLQLYYHTVPTPLGPFSLYVDSDGAIRCCHWQLSNSNEISNLQAEQREVCASLQTRWYKTVKVEMVQPLPSSSLSPRPGEKAAALLEQYFNPVSADAGRPEALELLLAQVPVAYPPTTTFMNTTWDVLRQTVPAGQTISYKGLGVRVSQALVKMSASSSAVTSAAATRAAAPRAIGVAMGANPIPVIIPCHRVLSSKNSLRGYGLGLRYKVWLLRHEQANVPSEELRAVEEESAVSITISDR